MKFTKWNYLSIKKKENKNKPLSDDKLTEIINQKYNLDLVRRTISKYRDQLKIPTSRERKRIYKNYFKSFLYIYF